MKLLYFLLFSSLYHILITPKNDPKFVFIFFIGTPNKTPNFVREHLKPCIRPSLSVIQMLYILLLPHGCCFTDSTPRRLDIYKAKVCVRPSLCLTVITYLCRFKLFFLIEGPIGWLWTKVITFN